LAGRKRGALLSPTEGSGDPVLAWGKSSNPRSGFNQSIKAKMKTLNAKYRLKTASILFSFLFFGLLATGANAAKETLPWSELLIFGDSYSDPGNLHARTNGEKAPSPPHWRGRFSDGPIWADLLPERLGLPHEPEKNFAFGGAFSDGRNIGDADWPGLADQVDAFLRDQARDGDAPTSASLAIIWAGANDYFHDPKAQPEAVVGHLAAATRRLAEAGVQDFLLLNLPDLGATPGAQKFRHPATLSALTREHNFLLAEEAAKLEKELGVRVIALDVAEFFAKAQAVPSAFGLANVSEPCFDGGAPCPDGRTRLFWDWIHPSGAAHRLLADLAADKLREVAFSSESAARKSAP
jgi:phospholipase/lecithinase/hemolysin